MKKRIVQAMLFVMIAGSIPMNVFASEMSGQAEIEQQEIQGEVEEGSSELPIEGETLPENNEEGPSEPEVPEEPDIEVEQPEEPQVPEIPEVPEIPKTPEDESSGQPQEQPVAPETLPATPAKEEAASQNLSNEAIPTASVVLPPIAKLQPTELFIAVIGEQARALGQKYDLYASVMIAQAILESDSGNSLLSRSPLNNLFGIKGDYQGQSVILATQEDNGQGQLMTIQDSFRQYATLYESMEDYAKLIRNGLLSNPRFYAGAWKSNTTTYQEATRALTGKYATDIYYDQKLNQLIETYQLTRFDKKLAEDEAVVYATLSANATKYLGVPYVWGGTSSSGFDCSGLVQSVYREALGVQLLRTTSEQETQGVPIDFSQLRTGDLLFWGPIGQSTHVAMYLTDGYFIHAPQENDVVKVTHLSEFQPDFARRIVHANGNE